MTEISVLHDSIERWKEGCIERRAFWLYENDSRERPHLIVTSPRWGHVGGFFDPGPVLEDTPFLNTGVNLLLELLKERGLGRLPDNDLPHRVLGAGKRAETLAAFVAFTMNYRRRKPTKRNLVRTSYYERRGEESAQAALRASRLCASERVLIVTDAFSRVLIEETMEAVKAARAIPLTHVGALANITTDKREVSRFYFPYKVLSLIDQGVPLHETPTACPYCQGGSEALHLTAENWPRLIAKYN